MRYVPRLPEHNPNISHESPLKELAILLLGVVGVVAGIYVLLGLAVNLVARQLPLDLERELGEAMAISLPDPPELEPLRVYVQGIADRLEEQCLALPFPVRVHVNPSREFNAAAMPGGHIQINTGLLATVRNENELAFVLAHEMGHIRHRDHLRGMGRGMVLVGMSAFLAGASSQLTSFLQSTLLTTEMSFSRGQEFQADAEALEALHCAYGTTLGAISFMSRMPAENSPGPLSQFFASHPMTTRRLEHLRVLAERNDLAATGEATPLPADYAAMLADKAPAPETR